MSTPTVGRYMKIVSLLTQQDLAIVERLRQKMAEARIPFIACDSYAKVPSVLNNGEKAFLLTEVSHCGLLPEILKKVPEIKIGLITGNTSVEAIIEHQLPLKNIGIIVYYLDEGSLQTISTSIQRQFLGEPISLEHFLEPDCNVLRAVIKDPKSKTTALAKLEQFFAGQQEDHHRHFFLRYGKRIATVADELILNGIFNANPKYLGKRQTEAFKLTGAEAPLLQYCLLPDRFGLAVRDPFGRLKGNMLLRYLGPRRSLQETMTELRTGLGLKMVFRYSQDVVVNLVPGQTTEIICLFKIPADFRQSANTSLHFFGQAG